MAYVSFRSCILILIFGSFLGFYSLLLFNEKKFLNPSGSYIPHGSDSVFPVSSRSWDWV